MSSFLEDKVVMEGLTYDDVLLVPAYSEVLPKAIGETTIITAMDLRSANYIKEDLYDANKKKCMNSRVRIYKYNKSGYTYTAYIYCFFPYFISIILSSVFTSNLNIIFIPKQIKNVKAACLIIKGKSNLFLFS